MRKLVLGIIAVICAQFAFVNYMAVQSPMELAIAPVQTEPRAGNPDLAWIDDPNNSAEAMPQPEVVDSRIEPRHTRARRLAANVPELAAKLDRPLVGRVSNPPDNPAPSTVSAPGEFESVVIRYNGNPDKLDCETNDIPKTKKRSFIAKAVPVIKKPWEWIKTIASKLN